MTHNLAPHLSPVRAEDEQNKDLMDRVKHDDEPAYMCLRARIEPRVRMLFGRWCRFDPDRADRGVQGTFTRLWERRGSWWRKDGATFDAWLFRVARSSLSDTYRDDRGRRPKDVPTVSDVVDLLGTGSDPLGIIDVAEVMVHVLRTHRVPAVRNRDVTADRVVRLRHFEFPDEPLHRELDRLLEAGAPRPSRDLAEHMGNGYAEPTNTLQAVADGTGVSLASVFAVCARYHEDLAVCLS